MAGSRLGGDHTDAMWVDIARRFVEERFPDAVAAFLGGSATGDEFTATSDLDIVVVREPPAPAFRETSQTGGRVVEAFVHTPASLAAFVEREVSARRVPLLVMIGGGVVLMDRDGAGTRLHTEARERLATGPAPLSPTELDDWRYTVTDLLDDLDGSVDRDELVFIGGRLLTVLAELVLLLRTEWTGNGKWLLRRLRVCDPHQCQRLLDAYRILVADADHAPLCATADAILDRMGGRLMIGYHRTAPPTD